MSRTVPKRRDRRLAVNTRVSRGVIAELRGHTAVEQLMLCMLADFADDAGRSYPAVATLANRCRIKPRHAIDVLQELRRRGLIEIEQSKGPRGANVYHVVLGKEAPPLHPSAGMTPAPQCTPAPECTLHCSADTPAPQCRLPLHPSAPEPSLNHQEPKRRRAKRTSLPEGFGISDDVRKWASKMGFAKHLDEHLEHFVGSVRARGAQYADFDQALMNAIRSDWGDIRKHAASSNGSSGPDADFFARGNR